MKGLLVFLRENSMWLHQVLFEYKLIYWDLWTLVHFMSGALVFACLSGLNVKKRWKWLFIVVAGFEVLEASVFIGVLKLFMPEKIPDVFMDIFVGMAGGYFAYSVFEKANLREESKNGILVIISSAIIAFFWTGYYGYQLNIGFGNFTALNVLAFLFWLLSGILIISVCRRFYKKFNNRLYAFLLVIILVFVLIVPFNYLITEVLNVRELSHAKTVSYSGLLFLQNTTIKFAVVFPFLLVASYGWFKHLTQKMHAYTK
ncbi:hypothetical protein [uncultured Draconibacterium sp.]|uniref:hypothetical protein n=1 Tax=uncultured Draconibacterium sp. TaxID=1573823 RepID=UPI003217890A